MQMLVMLLLMLLLVRRTRWRHELYELEWTSCRRCWLTAG